MMSFSRRRTAETVRNDHQQLTSSEKRQARIQRAPMPFCICFEDGKSSSTKHGHDVCQCGESANISEWQWEVPAQADNSWMMVTPDQRQVTFHPFYSSGTAMIKGNTPLAHDYQYYWEIKMLTEPYGTDIMVGVGTQKVDTSQSRFHFTSLLGQDAESYGLSYTGAVRHDSMVCRDGIGFCKGSIIGVKVDLWLGTLEFFLNRKSRGVSFFNLRRHPTQSLFPMICSTAAQSSMRLIHSSSWQASLLADAAMVLGRSVAGDLSMLPPGLKKELKNRFWLTFPNDSCSIDERDKVKTSTTAAADVSQEKSESNGDHSRARNAWALGVNFPLSVIYGDDMDIDDEDPDLED